MTTLERLQLVKEMITQLAVHYKLIAIDLNKQYNRLILLEI